MLIFGDRHLRTILTHLGGPVQRAAPLISAVSSARRGPITPSRDLSRERIQRRPVLGGLNEYERAA